MPLMAGGEPLGTLTLVRTDAVRRFTAVDRRIAEQLGHRAGAALLTGRLARERAEIARELQHGLLPPRLPDIPGLDVAALYRPAGELNEVGGDFYDAFPTPAGWMVVIGDVAGQGARAAALTGMARFTLRSVGQLTGDPVRAAEQLNRTLRDQPELSLCTAACVLLREAGDGLEALTVSMGHPLPALLRDGAVTGLGRPETLAGAFDDAAWTASRTSRSPPATRSCSTPTASSTPSGATGGWGRSSCSRCCGRARPAPPPSWRTSTPCCTTSRPARRPTTRRSSPSPSAD